MQEDLEIGKLIECFDDIPSLIENSKTQDIRNKANAENIKTILSEVASMKSELTSLKSEMAIFKESLAEAKSVLQEPITIQDKYIHITKDDIRVTQDTPDWVRALGNDYLGIKAKESFGKQKRVITIGGPKFSSYLVMLLSVTLIVGFAIYKIREHQARNSVESYAQRAYEAAIANDYRSPGDYYANIRELWSNGEIEDAKNSVEHWEQAARDRDYFKNLLSPCFGNQKIIIVGYARKDGEAVVWWRLYDDDRNIVSHIQKDGQIRAADASRLKIESIEDAHKYSKSDLWTTVRDATQVEIEE